MHEYDLTSDNVNGYPSYTRNSEYLYRNESTGIWMVAEDRDQMNLGKGVLQSTSAAELPTQSGLKWQYQSSSRIRAVMGTWKDDSAIVCEGNNKVRPGCPPQKKIQTHLRQTPSPKPFATFPPLPPDDGHD